MQMFDIKRGDIFLINTDYNFETKAWTARPFLVIQNDIGNKYAPTVIVMGITSMIDKPKLPTHVGLPREVSGLETDSVVLAEQIRTYDKKRLKAKIGELSSDSKYIIMVEKAMSISTGKLVPKHEASSIENDYKSYIKELTKPLIITEGKTDVMLIETAWQKLYPNTEMFFRCEASGIEFEKEKRQGNADSVRRTIEFLSNVADRPIIGLFDNDREGNEQYKGVSKKIFEKYDIKKSARKHSNKNIWAMLLPVPDDRRLFVTEDDMLQRYFVIEHYFSDDVLRNHRMYGRNILRTEVFEVNERKDEFSHEISDLDAKEFENFKILFKEIDNIFKDINNH